MSRSCQYTYAGLLKKFEFSRQKSTNFVFQDYHPYIGMTEVGTRFLESLGENETNFLSTLEVAQASIHLIENASTASVWHLHQKGDQVYEIPNETGYENLFKHRPK